MSYAERTLVICNHGGDDVGFSGMMDHLTEEQHQVLGMSELQNDYRMEIAYLWFYVGCNHSIYSPIQ
jgi:hypothetical protein